MSIAIDLYMKVRVSLTEYVIRQVRGGDGRRLRGDGRRRDARARPARARVDAGVTGPLRAAAGRRRRALRLGGG